MVLYIICGILGLNIIIMLYSTAASPFSKHKIKKICTFFSLVILFVCLLFSQEINTTKVSSEKENKYFLDLVDEICLDSNCDFSNIYVYKFENESPTTKPEYMFWAINENGKKVFFKSNNVTFIERQDGVPFVIEHIIEYEYAYERTNLLKAFGASEDPIPRQKKYELLVPVESIYTIN